MESYSYSESAAVIGRRWQRGSSHGSAKHWRTTGSQGRISWTWLCYVLECERVGGAECAGYVSPPCATRKPIGGHTYGKDESTARHLLFISLCLQYRHCIFIVRLLGHYQSAGLSWVIRLQMQKKKRKKKKNRNKKSRFHFADICGLPSTWTTTDPEPTPPRNERGLLRKSVSFFVQLSR